MLAREFSDDIDLKDTASKIVNELNEDSENNPYNFIDSNAQKMVLVLTKNAELFDSDREIYEQKIKDIFEPMIDFRRVAASAVSYTHLTLPTKRIV